VRLSDGMAWEREFGPDGLSTVVSNLGVKKMDKLDVIEQWVVERKAAYVIDVDKVVFFDSASGRKSDYAWVRLSLAQVARIISMTKLLPPEVAGVGDVVTVLQEQERMYERAVHSRGDVAKHIFNYTAEADVDVMHEVIHSMMRQFDSKGWNVLLYTDVTQVFNEILQSIKEPAIGSVTRNKLFMGVLVDSDYWLRLDRDRIWKGKSKVQAVMKHSAYPRDLIEPTYQELQYVVRVVSGELR